MGIEPTISGLDLPLLCRLSYEVGERKSGTIPYIRGEVIFQIFYVSQTLLTAKKKCSAAQGIKANKVKLSLQVRSQITQN